MSVEEIIDSLKKLANLGNINGMARFGINSDGTLGVSMPDVRQIAKSLKKNHVLALELWDTGIHEAKILAALIDDWKLVTDSQTEKWVIEFDSWDVCDQVCMNLFDKLPFAYAKAFQWAGRDEEFVRRAGFVLMASMAVHNKKAPDGYFEPFLEVIAEYSTDERNFVRKAVNWALRQIGKRNRYLNQKAIETAEKISETKDSKAARWIAADALRELRSDGVKRRIAGKK